MYKDFRYTEHTVCDLAIRYPHEHADDINLNTKKYTNDLKVYFLFLLILKNIYIYLSGECLNIFRTNSEFGIMKSVRMRSYGSS